MARPTRRRAAGRRGREWRPPFDGAVAGGRVRPRTGTTAHAGLARAPRRRGSSGMAGTGPRHRWRSQHGRHARSWKQHSARRHQEWRGRPSRRPSPMLAFGGMALPPGNPGSAGTRSRRALARRERVRDHPRPAFNRHHPRRCAGATQRIDVQLQAREGARAAGDRVGLSAATACWAAPHSAPRGGTSFSVHSLSSTNRTAVPGLLGQSQLCTVSAPQRRLGGGLLGLSMRPVHRTCPPKCVSRQ